MTLKTLQNTSELGKLLRDKMGRADLDRYVSNFQKIAHALNTQGTLPDANAWLSFTPGRIEVLGKHTDYGGGYSLVCAVEYGFFAVATRSNAPVLNLHDIGRNQSLQIDLLHPPAPQRGNWHNFAHSVVRRMTHNFGQLRGANITFLNDLPSAAGMSSSSAFIVMLFNLLASMNDLKENPEYLENIRSLEDVATYASTLENGKSFGNLVGDTGVGTLGGSQDHTAILCSKADELNLFSYAPTIFHESVPLPENLTFVVANSGVKADKTGNALEKYNAISKNATQLAEEWNAYFDPQPHLRHFLDRNESEIMPLVHILEDQFFGMELITRMTHFIQENACVREAMKALKADDWTKFAKEVATSQSLAEAKLKNQVPETIFLAQQAVSLGAIAASAFGAGFGGAVWALVEKANVDDFMQEWESEYQRTFPAMKEKAHFFAVRPGAPAFVLS